MNDNEIYDMLQKGIEQNIKLDFNDVLKRIESQNDIITTPVEVTTAHRSKKTAAVVSSIAACAAVGIAVSLFFALPAGRYSYDSAAEPKTYEESTENYGDVAGYCEPTQDLPQEPKQGTATADMTQAPVQDSNCNTPTAEEAKDYDTECYSTSLLRISSGRYKMKADDGKEHSYYPILSIDAENSTFFYCSDPFFSSYLCAGTYSIEGDKLTCCGSSSHI